ncbi:probable inactive poly [ADP-ribose] polymerase SRO3 [Argentina anserina]|uniref:probable inactive poly [ADP-ribose] polymerase SRO3 n=1 Tax=Argentina anserina TaxID=57926 RepID=UPI0021766C1A|nr:probable inactive poly [ADP-ribose] polymerase SRO3 [Potentilla anserina]
MDRIPINTDDFNQDDDDDDEVPMDVDDSDTSDSDSDEASESDYDSEATDLDFTDERSSVCTGNETMTRVSVLSREHQNILKAFAVGMGSAARATEVVAVHKITTAAGTPRRARSDAFRLFSEAVKNKCGGNPNIRGGWYGGSKEELAQIAADGFSSLNGDECGRIQLAAVKFALDKAMEIEAGDDGLRHMMLCRVILGKMEELLSGSKQCLPSSDEFDCGVDSVVNPRVYYVWSPYMNSYICPCYVVSFKAPASLKFYAASSTSTMQAASSAAAAAAASPFGRVAVSALVAALTRYLTPPEMKIVVRLVQDFRAKKITGEELKRKVRIIAGDKLSCAIKLMSSGNTFGGLQVENSDIYLPGLIAVLKEYVPAEKMNMLNKSLGDFRAKKMNRSELAQSVRVIVGDDRVLVAAINIYKIRKQQNNSLV